MTTVAPTPQQVETTLERFSKIEGDEKVAPKLKDNIDQDSIVNETGGNEDEVTRDEFDSTIKSEEVLEDTNTKLTDGQRTAIWNSAVVESVQSDLKDDPVEEDQKDKFVEENRQKAVDENRGITVDPDGRIEQLETARAGIQEEISKLEQGGVSADEKALLAQLKEERDKADGPRQVLLSNGANIVVNGSAVIELNPKGEDYQEELDANFSSVYGSRKEAYEAFVQQYETSTGKDFELKDNQSLIAYRRGDGLYYRVVESEVKENKGDEGGKQRVTAISDELSFTLEKAGEYGSGVTMQIAGEDPQNPGTSTWDPSEYEALPGEAGKQELKIGFSVYGSAPEIDSNVPSDTTVDTPPTRYVIDLGNETENSWINLLINLESIEDEDEDGIPDFIDPDYKDDDE